MQVRHANRWTERLEFDFEYAGGLGTDAVKAFRRRMQFIRAAIDDRVFYSMKSLHYEKLKGKRSHQRSMRLNDQLRLILEIDESPPRTAVIVGVEDYH